jgi:hypothetical protein
VSCRNLSQTAHFACAFMFTARALTHRTENREKIIKQVSKAIWSLIPLCGVARTEGGNARAARPPSARGTCISTYTHTGICAVPCCVWYVRGAASAGDHPQVNCRPQTQSHSAQCPTKTCRSLACSNKIRTIAGEQLAAPPTINGSLRQSPFFSLRPPLTIETNCALAAVPLLQCRKP